MTDENKNGQAWFQNRSPTSVLPDTFCTTREWVSEKTFNNVKTLLGNSRNPRPEELRREPSTKHVNHNDLKTLLQSSRIPKERSYSWTIRIGYKRRWPLCGRSIGRRGRGDVRTVSKCLNVSALHFDNIPAYLTKNAWYSCVKILVSWTI